MSIRSVRPVRSADKANATALAHVNGRNGFNGHVVVEDIRRAVPADTLTQVGESESAEPSLQGNEVGLNGDQRFSIRIQRFPLLTKEQVVELGKKIIRGTREERRSAVEQLVLHNLRLIPFVIFRHRYLMHSSEYADLFQLGVFGLMRAAQKFDYRKGFLFSSYATRWIRQSMQRGLDQTSFFRVPVHVHECRRRLYMMRNRFAVSYGREPSTEEMARAIKRSMDDIDRILSSSPDMLSLQLPVGEEDTTLEMLIADTRVSDIDCDLDIIQFDQAVRSEMMRVLTKKEMFVISMRFGLGASQECTLDLIGKAFGAEFGKAVSRERVRQLELRALRKLRRNRLLKRIFAELTKQ